MHKGKCTRRFPIKSHISPIVCRLAELTYLKVDSASGCEDFVLPADGNDWSLLELEIHNVDWEHSRWMSCLMQKTEHLTYLGLHRDISWGYGPLLALQWGHLSSLR